MLVAIIKCPTVPKKYGHCLAAVKHQSSTKSPWHVRVEPISGWLAGDIDELCKQLRRDGYFAATEYMVIPGDVSMLAIPVDVVSEMKIHEVNNCYAFRDDVTAALESAIDTANYANDMADGVDRQDTTKAEMHFHKDGIPCYQVHK